ncbi:MAG: rRNA maturation RNase YbeY [Clostridia bacterium]|nr:rRNA maturation RNase YbeY [Clostridia bacterium]
MMTDELNCKRFGSLKIIRDDDLPFDFEMLGEAVMKRLSQTADVSIELSFASEEEIKRLNADFRHIDRVTDVLSFPYLDGIKGKILSAKDFPDDLDEDGNILIGSLCVCLQRAREQAEEYGHSLKRELTYLVLHGILHCFGFDHIERDDEEEMSGIADEIMKEIKITREEI